MNGRVYDPVIALFLSPDNYVQDATSSLNFNRYTYCLNNPLIYTDPSGDFFAFPTIGWSQNSGLELGFTVGLGVPGFGVQYNLSYSFGSNTYGHTISTSAGFTSVYSSYSTTTGWTSGYSFGITPFNSPVSANFLSMGNSYNWKSGLWSSHVSAWNLTPGNGWDFNPGFGFVPFYYSNTNGFSYFGQKFFERRKTAESQYTRVSYAREGYPAADVGGNTSDILASVFTGVTITTEAGKALSKFNSTELHKLQDILETHHNINSIRINNQILKVARNGKIIKRIGVVGNFANLGAIGYDIMEQGGNITTDNVVDGFFGVVAFVPNVGWVISSIYTLNKEASKTGYYFSGDMIMW
jgi:hypothetical protein